MTEYQPVAPRVVDHEYTILLLAESWASTRTGALTVNIVRGQGFDYEATVKHDDGTVLIRERITIQPTMQAWVTDLLNRAGKERSS